jgi:hypothetical protein
MTVTWSSGSGWARAASGHGGSSEAVAAIATGVVISNGGK